MYKHDCICDSCTESNIVASRKKRCIYIPIRNRPFESLSPKYKHTAYRKETVELKVFKRKHSMLIAKLEAKNKSLMSNHHSSTVGQRP